MGVAFQGFYKRDRRSAKVIASPYQLYMHAQMKRPTGARGSAPTLILNKFRSRCERGRFTQTMLLLRGLATLYRRSEARPR